MSRLGGVPAAGRALARFLRRRAAVRDGLVVLVALAVTTTAFVTASPRARGQSDQPEILLELMSKAERATYKARQLVVYLGSPQSAAVLEINATPRGTFVRSEAGADVTRVWNERGRGRVSADQIALEDSSPPRVGLEPREVLEKYAVEVEAEATAMGVPVVPLAFTRRVDRRLTERLWVHTKSGMVYRRELYGATGELVGLQTTLEMTWGETDPGEPWDAGEPEVVEQVSARAADVPEHLPYSYRLVRSYRLDVDGREADHWVYSDGLHTLSVFRRGGAMERPDGFEPVDLQDGRIWAGPGPGTWTWDGDGATWVVVAEEPQLDPAELTEPLPRGGPSVWARLGSLWARGWRWLTSLF